MVFRKKEFPGIQYTYYIYLNEGQNIADKVFERMNIYDIQRSGNVIHAYLTNEEVNTIRQFKSVKQIIANDYWDGYSYDYFPNDTNYKWTINNLVRCIYPKKGPL